MREEAFRAYLGRFLSRRAVGSYLSNARRIERVLGTGLDGLHSDPALFARIGAALRADGATRGSVSDCLTAARRYFAFARDDAAPTRALPTRRIAVRDMMTAYETGLEDRSVAELMALYSKVLEELRRRELSRSGNGPVGDFAEAVFARAFGWRLAGNSEKSVDAWAADGTKVQIKGRRIPSARGARQLGAIRSIEAGAFDLLAVAIFDAEMRVAEAWLIPHAVAAARARYVELTNSWRIVLPRSIGADEGVQDVTDIVRRTAAPC